MGKEEGGALPCPGGATGEGEAAWKDPRTVRFVTRIPRPLTQSPVTILCSLVTSFSPAEDPMSFKNPSIRNFEK